MKNLKVGTKILLSFGVVVFMLLVVTVIVTVTGLGNISNVGDIDNDTTLQMQSVDMYNLFFSARLTARSLITGNDVNAFNVAGKAITDITASVNQMNRHIDANDALLGDFRAPLKTASQTITAWWNDLSQLNSINVSLSDKDVRILEFGDELTKLSKKIQDEQLNQLLMEYETITPEIMLASIGQMNSAKNMLNAISEFRVAFRPMVEALDLSGIEAYLPLLDQVIALGTAYRDAAVMDSSRQNAQDIIDSVTQYKQEILEFKTECDKRNSIINNISLTAESALSALNGMLGDIDLEVSDKIASTDSASIFTLAITISLTVVSVLAAVVLALIIVKSITGPLKPFEAFLVKAAATGDITMCAADMEVISKYAGLKDEIGRTINASSNFVQYISKVSEQIKLVAEGDLTVDITPKSDNDVIGNALKEMVDSLCEMFGEINIATNQVSDGSRQISDGAQSLAQGSTQQAASVQQLSAEISGIAQKTRENEEMARKAAELANQIKGSAEQGGEQMNQMMQSVKDINDASTSISRIIKVIDDIAFQTNILALNAAVEAARAGQHGKGFAVVAEEVRNLAAKSADAARETGALIANSIEKADLGSRIASETSASLAKIVSGISESTAVVGGIASSSIAQSASIKQINQGIEQVAQVVQQNSATAQQNAAASEEMSGQSALLKNMVSRFKLKEVERGYHGGGISAPKRDAMPRGSSGDNWSVKY